MYFQGILPYAICYHSTIFNYMKKKKKKNRKKLNCSVDLNANFKCSQRKTATLKTLQSVPLRTSAVNSS